MDLFFLLVWAYARLRAHSKRENDEFIHEITLTRVYNFEWKFNGGKSFVR